MPRVPTTPIVPDVIAIAAGSYHSLAVKTDGTVVGWGRNDYGQCDPPPGLSNVVAVAAGNYHSTALKSDGSVVCWGINWAFGEIVGQATPPPGLTGVVAIAAGAYHNLAVKDDGTLVVWGWNAYGLTNVPTGLSAILAISSSMYDNLVVTGGPVIRQQPESVIGRLGATVTFSIIADGNPQISYQWRFNGVEIAGAIESNYTRTNVQRGDIGMYSVVVSNLGGSVTSSDARLAVFEPPVIVTQPESLTATEGQSAYFNMEADGASPIYYQWRFNGADILDATPRLVAAR